MTRLLALALLVPSLAAAVPLEFNHVGQLHDSTGVPLDGDHKVLVSLYDSAASGTLVWSDTFETVNFSNGVYDIVIGSGAELDADDFDGAALYLEITLDDGTPIDSRLPVLSVPYALRALAAEEAASVVIGGETIIGADGTLDYSKLANTPDFTDTDTLADLALDCSADELAVFDGSDWTCGGNAPHEHAAADITSGKIDLARLPVGADSTSVAAGDHSHTSLDLSGGLTLGSAGDTCNDSTEGAVRFTGTGFEGCALGAWYSLGGPTPGSLPEVAAASCKVLLDGGVTESGTYWIDLDGSGSGAAFQTSCDMTTDGGGWTLAGTINGGDDENWNVQEGIWADSSTLGDAAEPYLDFKTLAWSGLDISSDSAEVLYTRHYLGTRRAAAVFNNTCLHDKGTFSELFAGNDTTLRCERTDITVVDSANNGEGTRSNYGEGTGTSGLAGSGTNGWCWNGGDDNSNTFLGHAGYNQSAYTSCVAAGHLSYIGVWQSGSGQYSSTDIDTTNWMNNASETADNAVSFWLRE